MPDKPGEKEPSELRAGKEHDEAKIVPSDLTNKKFVQDLYTNIKSDLILITEDNGEALLTGQRIAIRSTAAEWCDPFRYPRHFGHGDAYHVAQCEAIYSLEKTDIDTSSGTIGKLDDVRLREVIKAIGYALDSDTNAQLIDNIIPLK